MPRARGLALGFARGGLSLASRAGACLGLRARGLALGRLARWLAMALSRGGLCVSSSVAWMTAAYPVVSTLLCEQKNDGLAILVGNNRWQPSTPHQQHKHCLSYQMLSRNRHHRYLMCHAWTGSLAQRFAIKDLSFSRWFPGRRLGSGHGAFRHGVLIPIPVDDCQRLTQL